MFPIKNDLAFRPLHIRLLGPQAVMLQADAITKLLQQFWGTGRRIRRGEAFMGMISVTGQDEPNKFNESTG